MPLSLRHAAAIFSFRDIYFRRHQYATLMPPSILMIFFAAASSFRCRFSFAFAFLFYAADALRCRPSLFSHCLKMTPRYG